MHDIHNSRTPKQTPHFDTRSEINPSRTLVNNEFMKTFKSAQNMVNRARKCIWHCFSCEMGYLSTRLRSCTRLSESCAEIKPTRTRNNAICISSTGPDSIPGLGKYPDIPGGW